MILESQSTFATRLNVNRSTVSRWKESGRLVMQGKKVDVEASLLLIEQTRGGRDDLVERHRLEREEKRLLAEDAPEQELDTDPQDVRLQMRAAALAKALSEARIKQAEADLREMERDEKAGNLIVREDVDYVLRDYGALLRVMLDGRAERLGAEQGFNPEQITALAEADEQLLLELADKLKARGVAA